MKKLFTITLYFLFIANCFAQGFNWQWLHHATGGINQTDIGADAIATDRGGNVFMAGTFHDSLYWGPDSLINAVSNGQFYLVKFDSAGNVQWLKGVTGQLPGFTGCNVGGLATDDAGNVYLTGDYLGGIIIDHDTLPTVTNPAVLTIKYDGQGNLQWVRTAGGTSSLSDEGIGIATDAQNNVYVGGAFSTDTIYFGSSFLVCGPNQTAFLVKYDNAGNALWAKAPVANGQCNILGVATDAAGNIYCTGVYYSSYIQLGGTTLNNDSTGFSDIFTVKYDPSGNVIWAKGGHGVGYDDVAGITTLADGTTYIIGSSQSDTLVFDALDLIDPFNHIDNPDLFVLKYDASGNVLWGKNTTGIRPAVGMAIKADATGNTFCVGWSTGSLNIGAETLPVNSGNAGDFLAFLALDTSGNLLCSEITEGGGALSSAVCVDRFGNAYLGSTNYGSLVIGPDTLVLHDSVYNEAFILKFNCLGARVAGINGPEQQAAINIYPNPGNNKWQLAVDNELLGSAFEIWDNEGRMIYKSKIESVLTEINLPGIAQGVYLVRVGSDQFSITRKLVKL